MADEIKARLSPDRVYRLLMDYFTSQTDMEVNGSVEPSEIEVKIGGWMSWHRGPPGIVKVNIAEKNKETQVNLHYNYNKTYIAVAAVEAFWILVFILAGGIHTPGADAALVLGTALDFSVAGDARYQKHKLTDELKALLTGAETSEEPH